MATRLKPIGHEERLSIVEHLDELRTRIIICVVTFVVLGGICLWQADAVLDTINRPLEKTTFKRACDETRDPFEQSNCWQQAQRRLNERIAASAEALALSAADNPVLRAQAQRLARAAEAAVAATPRASPKRPVTLGVGEPFTATITVAAYAALLISLPLLLYQLYAFVLPAFSPTERQVALPLMLLVPFLFFAGVVFGYYVVLPAAVNFLQNYNDDNFDILLQARDYYKFAIMVLAAMGLLFQMPIVILAITRMGILTPRQLRRHRRYAILVIAVIAMLMPGQDPVTMLSMMLPMVVLYEGSILLASLLDRRAARARAREQAGGGSAASAELSHLDTGND
jgi:sec-independent protein translocase protein TatC